MASLGHSEHGELNIFPLQVEFRILSQNITTPYNYMNPGYFTLAAIDLKP